MKKIRKRILSFVLTLGLVGTGLTTNAYAGAWQKNSNGNWTYTENGTLKTGWFLDGTNWYYFNKSGNMITGWIQDQEKWYYMCEDGSLDDSKTTATTPNEIQLTYNIVKPFSGGLNIKYAGQAYTKEGTSFYNYGVQDRRLIVFSSEDDYGNKTYYYFYDPIDCKVYKISEDFSVTYLGEGNKTNIITSDQAEQNVKNYLIENKKYVPGSIKVEQNTDSEKDNVYIVHCYDVVSDKDGGTHNATAGWYYVDKSTGIIISML
ncbi:hypothetical protein [Clostridium sp.]|uniref:hypothetical protein n=1 Tax=Clostridium sp. TaxID=1506 RepID=UPI002632167C|nr:hypothetical protein [Clostridium sp.]